MKKAIVFILTLLISVSCALADEAGYAQVYHADDDAGRLSVRFVALNGSDEECVILTLPDGKIMMVDTAGAASMELVTKALDTMGVSKIDYLVLTHLHEGHNGNAAAFIDQYAVDTVYMTWLVFRSPVYETFADRISSDQRGIISEGKALNLGNGTYMEMLYPFNDLMLMESYPLEDTAFADNHSAVLRFIYGESSLLLAGDLRISGESDVMNEWKNELDCDVVKVNCHGAQDANSPEWIDTVSASIAVVCNTQPEGLETAAGYDANGDVYHTAFDGDVLIRMSENGEYDVITVHEHISDRFL